VVPKRGADQSLVRGRMSPTHYRGTAARLGVVTLSGAGQRGAWRRWGLFRVGYRPARAALPIGSSPTMLRPPILRQSPLLDQIPDRCGLNQGNTQNEKSLYYQRSIDFRYYLELARFEPRPIGVVTAILLQLEGQGGYPGSARERAPTPPSAPEPTFPNDLCTTLNGRRSAPIQPFGLALRPRGAGSGGT